LLYAAGGATDEGKLVKVDRHGNVQDLRVKPGVFHHVAMSPKEDRVAVLMQLGGKTPVYVIDLRRPELPKMLSGEKTVNLSPTWNPQGDKIVFGSDIGNVAKLWVHAIEGDAAATPVQGGMDTPTDWSRDGHLISYGPGLKSYAVLKMLKMGDTQQPDVLLDSGGDTFNARLSPNMPRLVYVSRKSGNSQIYVSAWPVTSSEEIQISTQGGSDPFWSKDGKAVFYRNGYQFMRVAVPESTASWVPKPELMFTGNYLNCNNTSWDLMPDGQHFIMILQAHPDPPKTELHLIQNWFEELKRLVPIK
jgi:Tol biopolymer transport system component